MPNFRGNETENDSEQENLEVDDRDPERVSGNESLVPRGR